MFCPECRKSFTGPIALDKHKHVCALERENKRLTERVAHLEARTADSKRLFDEVLAGKIIQQAVEITRLESVLVEAHNCIVCLPIADTRSVVDATWRILTDWYDSTAESEQEDNEEVPDDQD